MLFCGGITQHPCSLISLYDEYHSHCVIRAPAERIYRTFITADAWCKWLPSHGFTGAVHELNPQVGGRYRMSFTNFTTGHSHLFGGEYLELAENARLRYTAQFDDPNL